MAHKTLYHPSDHAGQRTSLLRQLERVARDGLAVRAIAQTLIDAWGIAGRLSALVAMTVIGNVGIDRVTDLVNRAVAECHIDARGMRCRTSRRN